jgi:hypothetical protein
MTRGAEMSKEVYEINRGSPSFRLNSIELEIETTIRKLIQEAPLSKQTIINKLHRYNKSDIAHVIKHSKGMWCGIDGIVEYRDWVYPDIEMDVGV